MIRRDNTVAVVLAGGRSSRMAGRKKTELHLAGEPLLLRVIHRISPQAAVVFVNLNEPVDGMDLEGFTIIPDVVSGYPGPLTGLASVFDHLGGREPLVKAVQLVPCDGPFLPENLLARLAEALNVSQADVACPLYAGEPQPTFSLWRRDTAGAVHDRLRIRGEGGFRGLLKELETVYVTWDEGEIDPFFNINTPADLARAEECLNR